MEKKITKKDFYEALRAMAEQVESIGDIPADDILGFIDHEVELLDKKLAASRKKAEEKRKKGDEMTAAIKEVLTAEYQTVDAIVDQIDIEDVTKAKIVSRLSNLFKLGIVEKDSFKDEESGRKLVHYKLAEDAPFDEADEIVEGE